MRVFFKRLYAQGLNLHLVVLLNNKLTQHYNFKTLKMEAKKITIQATVSATRQKTWDYYTQPDHITGWNFATEDWHCPTASNDMRIGGKYRARMEAKDGSFGFDFEATYNEIVKGESFIYAMTDGREVNVNLESRGNQTEITVTFEAERQNSFEMQRNGWQAILNNFKKYVETH